MARMQHLIAVGLDCPLLHFTLSAIFGAPAQVTVSSAAGRVPCEGRLEQTEEGDLRLILTEPYTGPAPVNVHLWVPSQAIGLEAPVLRSLSPNRLALSLPSWIERAEQRAPSAPHLALRVRYAVDEDRSWHSGTVIAASRLSLQLRGPVAASFPGGCYSLRLAVEGSPLPLSLRACCQSVEAEGDQYLMRLSLCSPSIQAERLLLRACGVSEQAEEEQVTPWR